LVLLSVLFLKNYARLSVDKQGRDFYVKRNEKVLLCDNLGHKPTLSVVNPGKVILIQWESRAVCKIRNPNFEIRNKSQIRMS